MLVDLTAYLGLTTFAVGGTRSRRLRITNAVIAVFALLNLGLAIAGRQPPRPILIALLVVGVCAFVWWIVSLVSSSGWFAPAGWDGSGTPIRSSPR